MPDQHLAKPGEDSHNLNIYQNRPFPVHVVLPVVGIITDKQGVQQFKAGSTLCVLKNLYTSFLTVTLYPEGHSF
jgi:hypothetical protein